MWEELSPGLGFQWEPCAGGARLLKLYGDTPCPVLPAQIAGRPLTELAPYCFAARAAQGGRRTGAAGDHAISGAFVTAITLPPTLRVVESAAFYNCRALRHLTLGPEVESLGSDLFTNCTALADLTLAAPPSQPTGLKKLLVALPGDITVHFVADNAEQARLFYPEFFELLDENAPAHIFNRTIEGEGYRYRQCFAGRVLHFAEYDAAFPRALTGEPPAKLCRLALCRLRFPFGLAPGAKALYRTWLTEHPAAATDLALANRDGPLLAFLCAENLLPPAHLKATTTRCASLGWSEGAALLLASAPRHPQSQKKQYRFDDLDAL
ncbi:MAG: leucine-rich repeat protein [Gemmiger sp.]|nr:leucine-rich repeat protein [Gemmiger sp.]